MNYYILFACSETITGISKASAKCNYNINKIKLNVCIILGLE